METSIQLQPGLHLLPAFLPVPTIGLLPINAYLVEGEDPYLIDTGMLPDGDAFVRQVESVIDPEALRFIYLTHTDPDHIGALMALLERAPRARIVTTFIGLAKLQVGLRPMPPDRVLLLNPGAELRLADRVLYVIRPPVFDAPETTMVYDGRLDALFSSDVFGGPLAEPVVLANSLPDDRLETMQLEWVAIDSPWIHFVDEERFESRVAEIAELDPSWILSSHLPPARQMAATLCHNLAEAPGASPFASPDQAAFEAILRAAAGEQPHV
jgi:flavorubredoxin